MASISPQLHQEFSTKLEKLLDDHDDISEKRSRISKALGGELKIIARGIAHARRVLKGLDGPQEEIPGTELGERRRDPAVEAILKQAERVKEKKEDQARAAARPAKDPLAGLVGSREEAVARHAGRPAPLEWDRQGDTFVAEILNLGTYCLEPTASGTWSALFTPPGGKSERVGPGAFYRSQPAARDACTSHLLERWADATLKNAGAGELTRADTKGPAVARKGGRRG